MNLDRVPQHYKEAIGAVLERVKEANPDDYTLLMDFVESVEVFEFDEEGTLGEWKKARESTVEMMMADERLLDGIRTGKILLRAGLDGDSVARVFVHEAGHAATRMDDLHEVGGPSNEWQSELAADRKAVAWGFRKEIEEMRKSGNPFHHAIGEWIEVEGPGGRERWKITEDYRMEFQGPAPPLEL